jgi:hypothetical protein
MNKYTISIMKILILSFLTLFSVNFTQAQQNSDSTAVMAILEEIFTVCNSASPEGESSTIIIFERLSQYILYTGNDPVRKNKESCNYDKSDDRKLVDETGLKIKKWLDKIENYSIFKYQNKKEGAIDKHSLQLNYKVKNSNKDITFNFVKIKDNFYFLEIK